MLAPLHETFPPLVFFILIHPQGISWSTEDAREWDILGYNIYREVSSMKYWVKISLMVSRGSGFHHYHRYNKFYDDISTPGLNQVKSKKLGRILTKYFTTLFLKLYQQINGVQSESLKWKCVFIYALQFIRSSPIRQQNLIKAKSKS